MGAQKNSEFDPSTKPEGGVDQVSDDQLGQVSGGWGAPEAGSGPHYN